MASVTMDEIILQESEKLEQIELATLLLKNQHSFTCKHFRPFFFLIC